MEKTLGQDIKDLDQRKAFLIDNADEVVEKTYTKNFDAEQLADKKTRLAEVSIKINDFENEIKDFKAEIGLQMKPLKEERSSLLDDIKAKGEVVYPDVKKYVSPEAFVVRVLDHHVEAAKHNLKGAAIVVSGGYGMGSKEGFNMLFDLAKVLHAEVGASRAAVDAGFCDADRQVGQTGVTVHPKVYIACGISGQIQHIAGMQDSGIIISINSDPDAPINKIADYVIVGTVEEVIPKLIKYYKQNSK
jgi:hypothetical protein